MPRNASSIRPALIDDARAIAEVHVESSRTTYAGILPESLLGNLSVETQARSWRDALAAQEATSVALVACDAGGCAVGFAFGGKERSGELGRDGEIYAIYLIQRAQRQGLGTLLVQRFVREMKARGIGSIAARVLAPNPFRQFYEALGGHVIAERSIERGGQSFTEIAYGWTDLNIFEP